MVRHLALNTSASQEWKFDSSAFRYYSFNKYHKTLFV